MKSFLISLISIALVGLSFTGCSTGKQSNELRVLYLGGQSEWSNGEYGGPKKFATEEDFQQQVTERMNDFGELLRTYFDSVTVMRAADYRPEMSYNYDVTIFDGVPPTLVDREVVKDENGRVTNVIPASYLPDDFSAASITIGCIGNTIGRSIGSKNDWYCLCLDADAHGMNLEHPIFNGPFKTSITLTKQPTPEDALHYQYFFDEPLPDSVMMWTVNTKGYKTEELFNAGMVSRPWGYTDSPDSEVMSSGVCAKTIDAVAIGRHGNFLTWGFIGGPKYMTEEAKTVFANAVVYMAQHNQAPIARKYMDRRAFSDYVKECVYLCKYSTYLDRCQSDSIWYAEMRNTYETAKAKKAKGEALTVNKEISLSRIPVPAYIRQTYAEFLQRYQKDLFAQFGEDESKYLNFYKEEGPYIYGLPELYKIEVDEDAKAWQIPNNDIRLIEKAIDCLEQGMEIDRAKRILERYTLCEFTQPSEWRAWFNKYKDKIFFTESGGWLFMVNEPGAPGNDYKALERREAAKKAKEETKQVSYMNQPDANNPVTVQVKAKQIENNKVEVNISLNILTGYHIYNKVGSSDPYLPLKLAFSLPDNCQLEGDAKMPVAKPFGSSGTTIYEDKVTLTQLVDCGQIPSTITCEVSFQCCDAHVCMPPFMEEYTVNVEK